MKYAIKLGNDRKSAPLRRYLLEGKGEEVSKEDVFAEASKEIEDEDLTRFTTYQAMWNYVTSDFTRKSWGRGIDKNALSKLEYNIQKQTVDMAHLLLDTIEGTLAGRYPATEFLLNEQTPKQQEDTDPLLKCLNHLKTSLTVLGNQKKQWLPDVTETGILVKQITSSRAEKKRALKGPSGPSGGYGARMGVEDYTPRKRKKVSIQPEKQIKEKIPPTGEDSGEEEGGKGEYFGEGDVSGEQVQTGEKFGIISSLSTVLEQVQQEEIIEKTSPRATSSNEPPSKEDKKKFAIFTDAFDFVTKKVHQRMYSTNIGEEERKMAMEMKKKALKLVEELNKAYNLTNEKEEQEEEEEE
jgi:hypothetical protein